MSSSEVWAIIGGISSGIAAFAALITIVYARRTVVESRQGRREAQAAHREDLEEARVARVQSEEAHKQNVAQQQRARQDFADAHREQMSERAAATATEIRLQRVLQAKRVAEVLMDLIETARAEHLNPPPSLAPPSPIRASRIPALLARLQNTVTVLESLGGPRLVVGGQLAAEGHTPGSIEMRYVGKGIDALREIDSLLRNDERLTIPEVSTDGEE